MAFRIRMGVPEMEAFWNDVSARKLQGKLSKGEETFFKKLVQALAFLGQNPRHPGLASHEIDDLSRKHRRRIPDPTLHSRATVPVSGGRWPPFVCLFQV